jgi:hypothetical protein
VGGAEALGGSEWDPSVVAKAAYDLASQDQPFTWKKLPTTKRPKINLRPNRIRFETGALGENLRTPQAWTAPPVERLDDIFRPIIERR